jgi:16S rRNA (uracil1498-N3)-methyltransferase
MYRDAKEKTNCVRGCNNEWIEPRVVRLYTEHDIAAGRLVALNANQTHYLRNVMRVGPGDPVTLFNGRDGEWAAQVETIGKKSGVLMAQHCLRRQVAEPGPHLYFAPLKRGPLDFLVQKAVELGVAALQPVLTERTVVSRVNHDRLRANIIEAAEQCERLSIPDLRATIKYTMLLDNWPADRHLLICVERGAAPAIDCVLGAAGNIESRDIFIGPEGGFTQSERDLFATLPFATLVSLGPRILRAETAALAALVCWQMANDASKR